MLPKSHFGILGFLLDFDGPSDPNRPIGSYSRAVAITVFARSWHDYLGLVTLGADPFFKSSVEERERRPLKGKGLFNLPYSL